DGERQEPQRHHRRKVERRDGGDHADRLPHDGAVDVRRDVLETVAHQHGRSAARHLDAFDGAAHAAARLVERLAVLFGDLPRDAIEMILEQLAEDRKSTRLNSSHVKISYAVFCLKKKKKIYHEMMI